MTNMNSAFNTKIPKKIIQEIYKSGEKLHSKSLILIWKHAGEVNSSQILISVPKKNIKKAVDRNYIKRIIKEIYRTKNNNILSSISKPICFILIYNKTTKPEFNNLKTELLNLFQILIKNLNENN